MYGAHIAISADRRWHWMYVEILLSYIRHSVRCNVAWPMRFKPAILGNSNLMPKNIGMHGKVVTVELTLYAALRKIRLQPIDEATQSCFLGKCDIIKYWIGHSSLLFDSLPCYTFCTVLCCKTLRRLVIRIWILKFPLHAHRAPQRSAKIERSYFPLNFFLFTVTAENVCI